MHLYASGHNGGAKCVRCGETVYAAEMMVARAHDKGQADDQVFHRRCFKCKDCGRGPLRPDDWAIEVRTGDLCCMVHFAARRNAEVAEAVAPAAVEIT